MNELLLAAAGLIVLTVAIGLARVLRGPDDVDRLMAVQLLGTGGIAALLLTAYATRVPGVERCRARPRFARGLRDHGLRQSARFRRRGNRPLTALARSFQPCRDRRRRVFLFRRNRRAAALSQFARPVCMPCPRPTISASASSSSGSCPAPPACFRRASSSIVIWALVLLSGASTAQLIGRALRRGRK